MVYLCVISPVNGSCGRVPYEEKRSGGRKKRIIGNIDKLAGYAIHGEFPWQVCALRRRTKEWYLKPSYN